MADRTLAGDKGVVGLSSGVLYLRWTSGAVVAEADARAVMAKVTALCPSHPRPMIVDLARLESVDQKARNVFAGDWPLTRVAVVGASLVDRIMVDYYVARHSPACATKFLASVPDAMAWLGVAAREMNKPQRLLPLGAALNGEIRNHSWDAGDADMMLNILLERAEGAIKDTRTVANGMPLFVVEAELTERLQAVLPGVRFTVQDIRAWAAELSS